MMKRTLGLGAVLAVCSAALLSLAGADFTLYNVMPYSPGREAQCAADCREYARRTEFSFSRFVMTMVCKLCSREVLPPHLYKSGGNQLR